MIGIMERVEVRPQNLDAAAIDAVRYTVSQLTPKGSVELIEDDGRYYLQGGKRAIRRLGLCQSGVRRGHHRQPVYRAADRCRQMMKRDGDAYELSSGKCFYANRGIIGIGGKRRRAVRGLRRDAA